MVTQRGVGYEGMERDLIIVDLGGRVWGRARWQGVLGALFRTPNSRAKNSGRVLVSRS